MIVQTKGEIIGEVAIVRLPSGSLDGDNGDNFKQWLDAAVNGNKQVVFDMSQVHVVDSAGLKTILSYMSQLREAGGDLKLSGLTKPVRMFFELVRLHRIFEIYNATEKAIDAFEIRTQNLPSVA